MSLAHQPKRNEPIMPNPLSTPTTVSSKHPTIADTSHAGRRDVLSPEVTAVRTATPRGGDFGCGL
jgi:hypothetical protein